jgi:hypothetical protein
MSQEDEAAFSGVVMMTSQYDPLKPPDPEEWLSLDEGERLQLVEDYHRRARVRLPNIKVHAAMHAVVETQIALGDEIPVHRTALRLLDEGLDRHEAIHAIASVLAGHMFDLTRTPQPVPDADPNPKYFAALEELTAKSWRQNR